LVFVYPVYGPERGKDKPQCARNVNEAGNASTSSSSKSPVMETESKVRYATVTPSSFPALHSAMKSARFLDVGVIRSAIEEREFQVECALDRWVYVRYCSAGRWRGGVVVDVLDDVSEEEDLGFGGHSGSVCSIFICCLLV
jgi:hypothetical protein